METKTCTVCGRVDHPHFFCKTKNLCKDCNKIKCKEYRDRNKEKTSTYNKEYRESHKEELSIRFDDWRRKNKDKRRISDQKYKTMHRKELADKSREYYRNNREFILLNQSRNRHENIEEFRETRRIYYSKNKDRITKSRRKLTMRYRGRINSYLKQLRTTNENYRLASALRNSMNKSLRNQKITKTFRSGINSEKAKEILEHIGNRPLDHHLDHIIPMCAFDLRIKEHRDMAMSQHNLRWISAEENLRKNKLIDFELIRSSAELTAIAEKIGLLT